jgi:hypothetical protein
VSKANAIIKLSFRRGVNVRNPIGIPNDLHFAPSLGKIPSICRGHKT